MAAAVPYLFIPGPVFTSIGLAAPIGEVAVLIALTAALWFVLMVLLLMWGNKRLDPGRVGILLMGEVVVGAASAALLTDEPFGLRQLVGGAMIVAAAVADIAVRSRRPSAPANGRP